MRPFKYIKVIPYGEDGWLPPATLRWGAVLWREWYKAVKE